jgi:hypothetical protein
MLKKACTLALFAIHFTAFAAPATQPTDMQFGAISLNKTTQNKIHHSGVLQLDGVKVEGETIINGFLSAKNSQFHDLTINGQGHLENTELLGPVSVNGQLLLKSVNADTAVTVYGFLGARSTVFTKPVTVTSTSVDFIDSTVKDITLEPVKDQQQTVNLTRTQVTGEVIFSAGNGIVKVDPQSSVKKVTGGKIEKVAAKPEVTKQ